MITKFNKMVMYVLAPVAAVVIAGSAAYAGGPIVYNQRGGSIPMYGAPTSNSYVQYWLPNSSRFNMICWQDFQWNYGNYWSNRWFWGQTFAGGHYGYVNASWVYYQWAVPRC